MGVETVLRIILALLIAGLVVAALVGLVGVLGDSPTWVGTGIQRLAGDLPIDGGTTFRDSEYIPGQLGASATFGPMQVVPWLFAMVYPAGKDGPTSGSGPLDAPTGARGAWLFTILMAFPGAIALWLGARYMTRFILGGG